MRSPAVPLVTSSDRLEARRFIESQGLSFEKDCEHLVGIYDEGRLVATGGLAGFVLKMLVIDPSLQGGSVLGELVTELMRLGRQAGHDVFWVFTRPEHAGTFEQLNFRLLVADSAAVLLEFGGGFERYLAAHDARRRPGTSGAIVINGNPFTLGHLYLTETAAAQVTHLHLFVVREDRSVFPFEARIRLAQEATAHVPNVTVLDTSRYAVSAGTFPSYFLKRRDEVALAQMRMDALLFAARLAPAFAISARFVGHEPYCAMTAAYNETMAEVLPRYGVKLVEIRRAEADGRFISATTVRDALVRGDLDMVARLVPASTLRYLVSAEGAAIRQRLAARMEAGRNQRVAS